MVKKHGMRVQIILKKIIASLSENATWGIIQPYHQVHGCREGNILHGLPHLPKGKFCQ